MGRERRHSIRILGRGAGGVRLALLASVAFALAAAAGPAGALVPGGGGGGSESCAPIIDGAGYINTNPDFYGLPGIPRYSRRWGVNITNDLASRRPGAAECQDAQSVARTDSALGTSARTVKGPDGASCRFSGNSGFDHLPGQCVKDRLTITLAPLPKDPHLGGCGIQPVPRPPADGRAAPQGFHLVVSAGGLGCTAARSVAAASARVKATGDKVVQHIQLSIAGRLWACGVTLVREGGTRQRPAQTHGLGACAQAVHEPGYARIVQLGTVVLWFGPYTR